MNKDVLETLEHLLDYCETRLGKHGVVVRSDLVHILNNARESYKKALDAFSKPTPKAKKKGKKEK